MSSSALADDFKWKLRSQAESPAESGKFEAQTLEATWSAKETAFIVCDVWDAHHCLNAVRRLEEFAPRMNDELKEARKRGATIIHSPSDCMAAYADHAARKRAIDAPAAKIKPKDIEHWCSRIPSEEKAVYPLDQSDGGEDDDPKEHAEWAAKLKEMGRNPGTPWKTQSKLIEIDEKRDFISDRGDEVWNVLESRGIKNVVLVGVHLNMCVLGRPFGLRQMLKNGKQVAIMRDMTDCMYNPKRWPHVDHFTGNELMVAHVEKYVCPTITSDQLLGGETFKSKYDTRMEIPAAKTTRSAKEDWTPVAIPTRIEKDVNGAVWYRCVVRLPKEWATKAIRFNSATNESAQVWLNGKPADRLGRTMVYVFAPDSQVADDYNLLVMRIDPKASRKGFETSPDLVLGTKRVELEGTWQYRLGDDSSWSNIPLPAKFGGATDMLFEVP